MSELDTYLAFAHQLADAAAAQTLPQFRNLAQVDNKKESGFDPVTEADRTAEAAMRGLIETHYPTHAILGEEYGAKSGAPHEWVLDPIDGTRAFISGMPAWGTLIAMNNGTEVRIGMMDQPFTGERFFAHAESDTFLRHHGVEKKCTIRPCARLEDAMLATTTADFFTSEPEAEIWNALTGEARLTRYGGDCYNYALLAAGQLDAVIEQGLKPYDIQALIPIIERAGGIVTTWQGEAALGGGQIIACGDKKLHDALLTRLAP